MLRFRVERSHTSKRYKTLQQYRFKQNGICKNKPTGSFRSDKPTDVSFYSLMRFVTNSVQPCYHQAKLGRKNCNKKPFCEKCQLKLETHFIELIIFCVLASFICIVGQLIIIVEIPSSKYRGIQPAASGEVLSATEIGQICHHIHGK